MPRYVPKRTHTRLTMRHGLKWTPVAASALLTLSLGSCIYLSGRSQDCAPTVSLESPSTVESVELIPVVSYNVADITPSQTPVLFIEPAVVLPYTEHEVELVSKAVWGEARGCSLEEQALVVWCVCNRVDERNQSITEVVTAPHQFQGYCADNPVEKDIRALVVQVLNQWAAGEEALVLAPYATTSEYLYFWGDGEHNWFREEY